MNDKVKGGHDMSKSVYSLVLDDDVVSEVDKLACRMNTSRSNLINTLLAQKLELNTPEMRMKEIFDAMRSLVDSRFQLVEQTGGSMLSMKSLLKYKYRPTIRYSVELARDMGGKVGRLKVRFRTTSESLISAMNSFFCLWQELERSNLSQMFEGGFPCSLSNGCYTRDFYSPKQESLSDEDIGNAIGRYIELIDSCIKNYFDNLDDPKHAASLTEQMYTNYLKQGVLIL